MGIAQQLHKSPILLAKLCLLFWTKCIDKGLAYRDETLSKVAHNPFLMSRKQPCHTVDLNTVEVKGRLCTVSFSSFVLQLIAWVSFFLIHTHRSQNDSDKEQRDLERRFREKEPERQRYRLDDGRKHRAHYEFDKFVRRNEEELKWGKGYNQDRGKKGNYNYSFTMEAVDKLGKEDKCDDMASKKERIRNKVLLFI